MISAALGASPASASRATNWRWLSDPAASPFERLLARRLEDVAVRPKPPKPTRVLHFRVAAAPEPATPTTQPTPRRLPRATPSFYIHSPLPQVLYAKGCRAGQNRAFGIVVLAFGKQSYDGHSYGTLTFSNRFTSNAEITRGMKAFARGYVSCLPRGSRAHIVLARGTSNFYPSVPSTYGSGWKWARETVAFARYLRSSGLDRRIASAAAIDAEPAWNPSFIRTRDFFRGYRAYAPGHVLYNYGSLDGGVGAIWNARQVWYVTGGMKYVRALPEIYYPVMARQWARMSRLAVERFGRPIPFAGLMTQHKARCGCGFRPKEAHQALVLALREHPRTWVRRLPALTNIKWE